MDFESDRCYTSLRMDGRKGSGIGILDVESCLWLLDSSYGNFILVRRILEWDCLIRIR